MDNNLSNNQAIIIGTIEDEFVFNHEIYAEKFYTFTVKVPRLSGASEVNSVPITVTKAVTIVLFLRCLQKTSATLTKKKAKIQTHFS